MNHYLRFLAAYVKSPGSVGAIAPSGSALANALCRPFEGRSVPARVLEVGAGTGVVTRCLGELMQPEDHLDICEINPTFVRVLKEQVLVSSVFERAVVEERVRLFDTPVQSIDFDTKYDFVISGLPLTAFSLDLVRDIEHAIRSTLTQGGVYSYFEYMALRKLSRAFAIGAHRKRLAVLSPHLDAFIRDYEFDKRAVLTNLPPAWVRYIRFPLESRPS